MTDSTGPTPWAANCRDCDYCRVFETELNGRSPKNRAVTARHGHAENRDHRVDVEPHPRTPGELLDVVGTCYKTANTGGDRCVHTTDNCRCMNDGTSVQAVEHRGQLPLRCSLCDYCVPGQDRANWRPDERPWTSGGTAT